VISVTLQLPRRVRPGGGEGEAGGPRTERLVRSAFLCGATTLPIKAPIDRRSAPTRGFHVLEQSRRRTLALPRARTTADDRS